MEVEIVGKGKAWWVETADDVGFAPRVVKGGKVETTQVFYSDVRSLKHFYDEAVGQLVCRVTVAVIVFGVLFAVTGIVCATGNYGN